MRYVEGSVIFSIYNQKTKSNITKKKCSRRCYLPGIIVVLFFLFFLFGVTADFVMQSTGKNRV